MTGNVFCPKTGRDLLVELVDGAPSFTCPGCGEQIDRRLALKRPRPS